jgi:hypothetical protein
MRRILAYSFLLAFATSLSGCLLFFEGDDDDYDDCLYPPGGGGGAPLELRNPDSGQCEYIGGGGWCDTNCGPCDTPPGAEADEAAIALPSWGVCNGFCSGLDEATCLDTPACRGGYVDTCPPNADCDSSSIVFAECWSVDMTGPISDGTCTGLDAWSCSQHDNCRAVHANACPDSNEAPGLYDPSPCVGYFKTCLPETAPPNLGTCYDDVVCRALPPECPVGTLPGVVDGCWSGYCIPEADCEAPPACSALTEPQCIGRSDCDTLYTGVDCSCDANGCTCADWVYEGCETM